MLALALLIDSPAPPPRASVGRGLANFMQLEPPVEAGVEETAAPPADAPEIDADESLIEGRKRPGQQRQLPDRVTQENPGAVRAPPPEAFPTDSFPVPDRWRLIESLGLVRDAGSTPTTRIPIRAIARSAPMSMNAAPIRWMRPRTMPISAAAPPNSWG